MVQDRDHTELHVLIIPAWMPTASDKARGAFMLDHTIALQDSNSIRTGLLYMDPVPVPAEIALKLEQYGINALLVRSRYIPKASAVLLRLWCLQYRRAFRKYVDRYGKPDLLHAHSYIAGLAAFDLSASTGIPYVLTEHSTNFRSRSIRRTHIRPVQRMLRAAKCVIAVGHTLQRDLKAFAGITATVIGNPIDNRVFYVDKNIEKDKPFTIMAVGSLILRKRIDVLLQAIAQSPECVLHVIGEGEDLEQLRILAKDLGIDQRVKWSGYQNPYALATHLRRAHVLVSTSSIETFGIVAAEALMCGIPVIAVASGGPEEFIHPGQGIVLPANADAQMVAAAIQSVRDKYAHYNSFEISAVTSAQFSRDIIVPKIIACYESILT